MKFGAVYPHQEIGSDPTVIRDWAQTAEGLGFSHIVAYDHVLGAAKCERESALYGPYDEKDAFHEPMVLFGFLAACTQTIEFATGILILPQRQTALLAKQITQLDLLSKGRMRLGVGTGWNFVEYESLNEDFNSRGKRMTEQVEVLRELWCDPVLDYSGQFHRIDRAGLNPLPGRDIPICFGGFSDVAFRRAARMGDGIILGGSQKANVRAAASVRKFVEAEERNSEDFGIEAFINFQDGEDAWRKQAEEWQDLKATYVSIRATELKGVGEGLDSPAAHIEALKTFWRVVSDLQGI